MSEYAPQTLAQIPPAEAEYQQPPYKVPEIAEPGATLRIRYTTFEAAQEAEKKYSDDFIDSAVAERTGKQLPFMVGTEIVGPRGYLDKVEATPNDEAVIDNPETIAALYLQTTDVIARNLKIKVAKGTAPERVREISTAKNEYLTRLKDESLEAADKIVSWCETDDFRIAPRPGEAFGYYGFKIGENDQTVDVFDQGGKNAADFHPNLKIQRQAGGNFIFGYSDSRVSQRMDGQKDTLSQRIYLNPDFMATPQVFEQVLDAANKAGIPLELKMLQRSEEVGAAHIEKKRNANNGDALRGDGVVIYTSSETADDVLALALAIAQDNPQAFVGRKTSRIPQAVGEGVAIGSEPNQKPGQDAKSLTESRAGILATVAQKVAASGKTGQEARDAFRRGIVYYAEREGIDPKNIAFNAKAA